jgi:PKD repeat protein
LFKQSGDGAPGEFEHTFPQQGIYKIKLEVTDNENNKISRIFQISVSDPVAIIRAKPDVGTTSTPFIFDASASYSISSKVRKYQWQVFDPQGNQIHLIDAKELKQQFVVPGIYTIKLTVTDV